MCSLWQNFINGKNINNKSYPEAYEELRKITSFGQSFFYNWVIKKKVTEKGVANCIKHAKASEIGALIVRKYIFNGITPNKELLEAFTRYRDVVTLQQIDKEGVELIKNLSDDAFRALLESDYARRKELIIFRYSDSPTELATIQNSLKANWPEYHSAVSDGGAIWKSYIPHKEKAQLLYSNNPEKLQEMRL